MMKDAIMFTQEQVEQAAGLFVQARQSRTPGPRLPESCRPPDANAAIAIQHRTLELLGEKIGGWKCGIPTPNGVMLAPITASTVTRTTPAVFPGKKATIEPEIAFVMGRDLPPRDSAYTDEEIRDAVLEARFCLELINTRFANKGEASFLEILADCFNNWGLFVGPVVPDAFSRPLEKLHAKITTPTATIFDDVRAHPSGHPLTSFTWLAHYLNGRGEGLKAGEIVTTGSYAGIVDVPAGQPVRVELEGIGVIETEFSLAR
jgi:2-keto-4-pentenoate hydratase